MVQREWTPLGVHALTTSKVAVDMEQVAEGGQRIEKASDLRARARRSGGERESYE